MRPSTAAAAVVVALALPIGTATAAPKADDTIDLPAGFAGEGVAVGAGNTFYAGSRAGGHIARGNLGRRAPAEVWVTQPILNPAIGLAADVRHGLLWVAGGGTGDAAAYHLATAAPAAPVLPLTSGPAFINDVAATRDAAYFTNSLAPELYRVPVSRRGAIGTPETIELGPPAGAFVPGFNLNGIDATKDGKTLIVVNSTKGELYTVDAATGASRLIDLGGATVPTGDGILLDRRMLYVLQNGNSPGVPNQIAVIQLSRDLTSGRIVATRTSELFETATTLAKRGNLFVAVNAQFEPPPIDAAPEVVVLRIR